MQRLTKRDNRDNCDNCDNRYNLDWKNIRYASSMKIVDVQWRSYRLPLLNSFSTAHSIMTSREGIIVQVTTSQGVTGIGEIAPLPALGGGSLADAHRLLPELVARLHNKTLHEALDLVLTEQKAGTKAASTLCGLEIALLDAIGKAEGHGVCTLLTPAGFAPRAVVPVNAVIGARTAEAATAIAQDARKN